MFRFRSGSIAILVSALATSTAFAFATSQDDAAELPPSDLDGRTGETYPLDAVPREIERDEKVACAHDEMVRYRSRALRYAVTAHPDFIVRLQRFEALVIATALEHYGRAPRKLIHHGVYSCRKVRKRGERISEHALGNAIDLKGFDFGPLPRRAGAPAALPNAMKRSFSLRVGVHWQPRRERDAYHARFLHQLVEELKARTDIFRGIVGPPQPRHHAHLHLDVAPSQYAMYAFDESS